MFLEERKAQIEDRFIRRRQLVCMIRSHFGSSGYFAQGDDLAVSELALASTHFGRIVMSTRLSQQPTQTAAPLSAEEFDPQPHEITVPDETQHSLISNTGSPCSGSADNAMCPPVSRATGDGFTGTGVPAGSAASLEAFLRDLSVLQTEQFAVLTNSIASIQRQLSELTHFTSRTSEWMRAQQAPLNKRDLSTSIKPSRLCVRAWTNCSQPRSLPLKQRASFQTGHWQRLQDEWAQVPTSDSLRATLPTRMVAVVSRQASGKNPRSHRHRKRLRNCIRRMTNFSEVSLWSIFHLIRAKILSRNFVVKPFPVQNLTHMRSNARKAATMLASGFTPEQHVNNLLRPIRASDCGFLPITPWLSANQPMFSFAKQELPESARWGIDLAPFWIAVDQFLSNHFKNTAGIQATPVVDGRGAGSSVPSFSTF